MRTINKKGISDVVGMTMIVLLTIVAAGVMWSYVNGIISPLDSRLSPVTDCIQLGIEATNVCYNAQTGDVEMTVGAKGKLNSFTVLATKGQSTKTFVCDSEANSNTCSPGQCVLNGETKKLFLPEEADSLTYLTYYGNGCTAYATQVANIQKCVQS